MGGTWHAVLTTQYLLTSLYVLTQNVSNQKFHIINSEKISLAEPQPAAPRRAGHRK